MSEILRPVVLIGLIVSTWIVGGFIEARLSLRHPSERDRLGSIFHFGTSFRVLFAHQWKWMKFIWLDHFRMRDPALTGLCVLTTAMQIGFFAAAIFVP